MIKPANELKKAITKREIIDYLEDYLMEQIDGYAKKGYGETSITGYSISVCQELGQLERGLHDSNDRGHVWLWKSVRDYVDEVTEDFRRAGYRVYDKNRNGCIWVNWE